MILYEMYIVHILECWDYEILDLGRDAWRFLWLAAHSLAPTLDRVEETLSLGDAIQGGHFLVLQINLSTLQCLDIMCLFFPICHDKEDK
jgi:hypothetical protein